MHNTGINIAAEKLTALSSVHQFDYSQMDNSSHQYCVVHYGASDDRAEKCSVKGHRRRYLSLHTATTGKQILEIYVSITTLIDNFINTIIVYTYINSDICGMTITITHTHIICITCYIILLFFCYMFSLLYLHQLYS